MGKHTRSLTHLASPGRAGRGNGRGRTTCKASQARDLLLSFSFVTSPRLIRFDRYIPNQLRDVVTLGWSSL
jgi:hypothetical protein